MPVFTPTVATGPREELAQAIVEGEGAVSNLIGDKLMPDLPLTKRTAHLPKITLQGVEAMRTLTDQKFLRAPGTRYERITAQVNDFTFSTNLIGNEIVIPNETKMEWDEYLDLVAFFSAQFGTQISGLTKELLRANILFNPAYTYRGTAMTPVAAYTAANRDLAFPGAGMNPIQDIIAAARYIKGLGEIADCAWMSGQVWERVRTCQATLQFIKGIYGPMAEVNEGNFTAALAAQCGVKELLIGDCYINIAASNQVPSLTPIWSTAYIGVGRKGMSKVASEKEGVSVPTISGLGVTPFWTGFENGGKPVVEGPLYMEGGNYVETYPSLEINSLVVRVGMSSNPTVTNNRAFVLIATSFA